VLTELYVIKWLSWIKYVRVGRQGEKES
jgi:hypothetical protein